MSEELTAGQLYEMRDLLIANRGIPFKIETEEEARICLEQDRYLGLPVTEWKVGDEYYLSRSRAAPLP
jgi:hypothetical protein